MMNYESRFTGNDGGFDVLTEEQQTRRKWMWIIGALVAAILIIVAASYFFSSGKKDGAAATAAAGDDSKAIPTITISIPGQQTVERIINATGNLAAKREMPIGVVGEGGMISRVLVEPGQWVQAGQVLATIERSVQVQRDNQNAAQVNVARADARLTQSELDRAQALVARGFISKADIDRKTATRDAALARVRVAEAELAGSRAQTGRLDIRAPAAGLVLTRAVEPGQVVSAGSGVLFSMAKGGELELRAMLGETDLAALSNGVSAVVTPVGSAQSFTGQIWQVSPVVDPQNRQGMARIALSYNPELRPGGFASAKIVSGTTQAPLLPESAVLSDGKGNYVYIVGKDEKVSRREVKTGSVSDAGIAILSGLTGQERVVLSAGAFLNEGDKVIAKRLVARK